MIEIRARLPQALRRAAATGALVASALVLQACASLQPASPAPSASYKVGKPYQVGGIWYVPREQPDYDQVGVASWYGDAFQMKATASGELFDMNMPTAAHTTLPLPSIVEVTNLDNGRRIKVRVNDRGPFVGDRIIDMSREAARELGYERQGLAHVRVRYVGRGDLPSDRETGRRYAQAGPLPAAAIVAAPAAKVVDAPVDIWSAPEAAPAVAPPAPATMAASTLPAAVPAVAPIEAAPLFKVQAGAFSDQANAQRAAARLAVAAGNPAAVEPLVRDGVLFYRVTVLGGTDEVEAEALRARVIASGFADARVVRPF
jgi:rare lipoprotein A